MHAGKWMRAVRAFFIEDQSGQTLPLVALFLTAMVGFAGFVVDVGHVYVVQEQIQNSANAAALASAGYVYTSNAAPTSSITVADQYAATGSVNPNPYVKTAPLVQQVCINALMPTGTTCTASSAANAVRVTQTAKVNTYFMGLFGYHTVSTSATAMASMVGGQAQPWNVAIVLDGTGSMNNADPNCGSGVTEFKCATTAIQNMLSAASPCAPTYTTCASAHSNLRITLFSFPGISTSTVSNDTTGCTQPTFMQYTLPKPGNTSYSPLSYTQSGTTWTGTYQIVPFSSDYYSASSTNNLNTSSTLVSAVTKCMAPIQTLSSSTGALQSGTSNGGVTYFAAPMYAAQSALLAEQAANPGSLNALILLGDGQANMTSQSKNFPGQQGATFTSGSPGTATPTGNGTYPDVTDECQQAILAAQSAANAGTRVYAVAYGAESQGCSSTTGASGPPGSWGTDNTTIATGTNQAFTATSITPCITMENIASNLKYFYSDYDQSDAGTGVDLTCIDNAHQVVSLNDIMLSILSDFLIPHLIPPNTPYTVVSHS